MSKLHDEFGLRELPLLAPPVSSWESIRRRAEDDGLLARCATKTDKAWLAVALAASVALLAIVALTSIGAGDAVPAAKLANTPSTDDVALLRLQKQSSLYERALTLAPRQPSVVPVGLASRDTALRDRIVAIDRMMRAPPQALGAQQRALLWSERTMLLRELVGLRYAHQQDSVEL